MKKMRLNEWLEEQFVGRKIKFNGEVKTISSACLGYSVGYYDSVDPYVELSFKGGKCLTIEENDEMPEFIQ